MLPCCTSDLKRRLHLNGKIQRTKFSLATSPPIPFALLLAVAILVLRGVSANLLSVGAIDLGLIVDSNFHHRNSPSTASTPPAKWRSVTYLSGPLTDVR